MHTMTLATRTFFGLSVLLMTACGAENQKSDQRHHGGADARPGDGSSADSTDGGPRLALQPTDQVLGTLIIPFGQDGLSLTDTDNGVVHWVVDMEERKKVAAGVAPDKYLKVKGDLSVPLAAENRPYDVGCIYVELKDNVYYREQTWLRLATTGINGKSFTEVKLPLSVDLGGWQSVPELGASLSLSQFSGNTIKKFNGTLCFRLDFTDAPAQLYEGNLIVQYLRPGNVVNPPACGMGEGSPQCQPSGDPGTTPDPTTPEPTTPDPTPAPKPLSCLSQPVVLKAGQQTNLSWLGDTGAGLTFTLAADSPDYKGALGTIAAKGDSGAVYTAPAKVPANVRIIATARAMGLESLPAFCQVNLIADEQICVKDDGEIKGLTGNVFKIPSGTSQMPDLDQLTPVAKVVVPNLDIPERRFSAGFPGVVDLFEWFAIRFKGQLIVPENATCKFMLTSDDGAILKIDGNLVVDDDGTHPTKSVTGQASLTKGTHDIRIDYYQGPRYYITLQLLWQCGNAATYQIVPPEAFTRPLQ